MNTMFINIYYILDSNSLKYLIAYFFFGIHSPVYDLDTF